VLKKLFGHNCVKNSRSLSTSLFVSLSHFAVSGHVFDACQEMVERLAQSTKGNIAFVKFEVLNVLKKLFHCKFCSIPKFSLSLSLSVFVSIDLC
jgi:hypothetical protein